MAAAATPTSRARMSSPQTTSGFSAAPSPAIANPQTTIAQGPLPFAEGANGAAGTSLEPTPLPAFAGGDATMGLHVIDPANRSGKIWIPREAIFDTAGSRESPLSKDHSLCMLFQKGRCNGGTRCHQIHASRDLVAQLRAQSASTTTCCAFHGDVASNEPAFAKLFGYYSVDENGAHQVNTTRMLTLQHTVVHIKKDRMSRTIALDLIIAKNNKQSPPFFPVTKVCGLHQKKKCYYGKDCKHIHICREYWARLLAKGEDGGLTLADLPDTLLPEKDSTEAERDPEEHIPKRERMKTRTSPASPSSDSSPTTPAKGAANTASPSAKHRNPASSPTSAAKRSGDGTPAGRAANGEANGAAQRSGQRPRTPGSADSEGETSSPVSALLVDEVEAELKAMPSFMAANGSPTRAVPATQVQHVGQHTPKKSSAEEFGSPGSRPFTKSPALPTATTSPSHNAALEDAMRGFQRQFETLHFPKPMAPMPPPSVVPVAPPAAPYQQSFMALPLIPQEVLHLQEDEKAADLDLVRLVESASLEGDLCDWDGTSHPPAAVRAAGPTNKALHIDVQNNEAPSPIVSPTALKSPVAPPSQEYGLAVRFGVEGEVRVVTFHNREATLATIRQKLRLDRPYHFLLKGEPLNKEHEVFILALTAMSICVVVVAFE
eukprot:TRINITY_DN4846_c0_g1_i1.p1 TRINITY_DN4846_c0_g1~~TRINITY_DN4846_c0_g1_i1.p1  ORF type:complete len:669 (-),score=84.94 TRINITY_DN4846_c0_g1_i1:1584-3563(-)